MALFPLGILSAAGAGGAIIPDYELISSTIVGTATPSVTFSNLGDYSSTYKHLQLRMTFRESRTSDFGVACLRLNGDTGSNYVWHSLVTGGSGVSSGASTGQTFIQVNQMTGANNTANQFGVAVIDILDPYSTTKNKTLRFLQGNGNGVALTSGLHLSTASITSFTVFANTFNIVVGSRLSLYGIKG